ncbi:MULTISPECIES: hypothetical protein [Myroides]|uniref:hypothetical protein n=1 Tax=Myroides TaxID=76831 RepID=UPI0015F8524F|nr:MULTISPECIES: hypothetical protein [Myroides]MBB1139031.1 hypothetical protein [Myroides sp. WP-1]MDM1035945.1 hypothetical protein [Myroides odoratimimus]MDM1060132.1 hypothetical protein [Myroides odoratimimus]
MNNKESVKRLVHNQEQASKIVSIISEDEAILLQMIENILFALNNPIVMEHYNNYPKYIEEYGIENLLKRKVEFEENDKFEFEVANMLMALQLLISCAFELIKEGKLVDYNKHRQEVAEKNNFRIYAIESIINMLGFKYFMTHIYNLVILVVGEDNYKIITKLFSNEDISMLEKDNLFTDNSVMQYNKEIVIWFGMIRVFIDLIACIVELNADKDNLEM